MGSFPDFSYYYGKRSGYIQFDYGRPEYSYSQHSHLELDYFPHGQPDVGHGWKFQHIQLHFGSQPGFLVDQYDDCQHRDFVFVASLATGRKLLE
jgi:hypothetical protein